MTLRTVCLLCPSLNTPPLPECADRTDTLLFFSHLQVPQNTRDTPSQMLPGCAGIRHQKHKQLMKAGIKEKGGPWSFKKETVTVA